MYTRTAVAVVAFNRPHYFRPSLRSLFANAELTNCDLWIFLDGGPRGEQLIHRRIAEQELCQAKYPPRQMRLICRRGNLDCGRNLIDARRRLFDYEGYQLAYIFEDDMLLSPHYMTLCNRMHQWAQANYWNVGVVQAYNTCWLTRAEKETQLRSVLSANAQWAGYLLSATTWSQIRALLYVYEDKFLRCKPYRKRDIAGIDRWVQNHLLDFPASLEQNEPSSGKSWFAPSWDFRSYFASNKSLGQDAMTALALALVGKQKLVPVVNRGLPIGRQGIHSTDASFRRQGLDQMQLDLFDADSHITEFEPLRHNHSVEFPQALPLQPYMRADETATMVAWLRQHRPRYTLEFGAGGSSAVFSQVVPESHWWSLEQHDLWIHRVLSCFPETPNPQLTLLACPAEALPAQLEKLLGLIPFDLFVVDGYDRPAILQRLSLHLRHKGGQVLLHDFARPDYQSAISLFARRQQLSVPYKGNQGWLLLEQ